MHHIVRTALRGRASILTLPWASKGPSAAIEAIDTYGTGTIRCAPQDLVDHGGLRWAFNEPAQLKDRHVEFNVNTLISVAEETAGHGAVCSQITKLPEGNFNKVFMVTMQDGRQLVIRIPNPNAGPSRLITASEVATMTYIRDVIGLPVPKVLSYCSGASKGRLGVEYIIMEKARGIELSRLWETMTNQQKIRLVENLAKMMAKLSETQFAAYGSLYYREDLSDLNVPLVRVDDEFSIGPMSGRAWFDDARDQVECDRGPCALDPRLGFKDVADKNHSAGKSSSELLAAMIQREITSINKFPKLPRNRWQGIYGGPGGYHPIKGAKLSALHDALKILPHIMPPIDSIRQPVLWHTDLHHDNIFVDENDPSLITDIIDWQGTSISPMFLTARHPSVIEHEWEKSDKLTEPPPLPDNISELPDDVQAAEKKRYLAQMLWVLYELETSVRAPDVLLAFRWANTIQCQIFRILGVVFNDGEMHLQRLLAQVTKPHNWSRIVGEQEQTGTKTEIPKIPCPIHYSAEELAIQEQQYKKWERDIERKAQIHAELGVASVWDGGVIPGEYEEVMRRLQKAKDGFLDREAQSLEEREAWEKVWPFKNDE